MERTPLTSEITHEDDETTPSKSRNPVEVVRDWWADRQRMVERENEKETDDEEEDDDTELSPSDKKQRRITKVLKGFFGKNVERHPVTAENEAVANPDVVSGRSLPGLERLVAVEDTADSEEAVPVEQVNEPEETTPAEVAEVTSEVEVPSSDEAQDERLEPLTPEADVSSPDDEDTTVTTRRASAGATPGVPPTTHRVSGGGTGGPGAPGGGGTGGVGGGGGTPPPGAGVPRGPGSGGNFAPQPITIDQRTFVEEHHHHRRAALGALIIAERIDNHRNKKRKEQIKQVEKANDAYKKQSEQRISQLEAAAQRRKETTPTELPQERPQPVRMERPPFTPLVTALPERETPVNKPPVVEKAPPKAADLEHQPKKETPIDHSPLLSDLEHNRQKDERKKLHSQEDIIATAERLAKQAETNETHEIYDERWHEIKDPKTAPQQQASVHETLDTSPFVPPLGATNGVNPSQQRQAGVDPLSATTQDDRGKPSLNGLWAMLVIGVIVGILLLFQLT